MRGRDVERWDFPPGLDAFVLAPAAALYAAGWLAYASVYALGLKRAASPGLPTLCVGNRRVGGSGKTPFTLYVADLLRRAGERVVVGMSAYGSPAQHGAALAPEGPLDPARWGDEPAMVRWVAPGFPLVLGRDRVAAARIAAEAEPGAVLVMDDGFQHLRLAPHVRLLLDPPAPNRLCLPAGPYREPASGRRRADLVLPSPEFAVVSTGVRLWTPERAPLTPAQVGPEVDALCALARPHRFQFGLEQLGLVVRDGRWERDHDPLDRPGQLGRLGLDRPLVVTAKDWVKLRLRDDLGGRRIVVADYAVAVDPEPAFLEFVHNRLRAARAALPPA